MKKNLIFIFYIFIALFLTACSSSKDNADLFKTNSADSLYVFDSVPIDSIKNENFALLTISNVKLYIVQIGAFTTKDKAELFAANSKKIINYDIDIAFSNSVNLYVVQLKPFYNKKEDAEMVRNKLWTMDDYKDAWILTVIR